MPLIPEDQLPEVGGRLPEGRTEPVNPFERAPGWRETLGAAWDESVPKAMLGAAGDIYDVLTMTPTAQRADPNYNPLSIIKGTRFEQDYLDEFLGARSDEDTYRIMGKLVDREQRIETLNKAGWAGVVAQIGVGLADPLMYIPLVDVAATAGKIGTVARGAARMAALGAVQSGVGEAILQTQQPGRTAGESLGVIASSTILSGILGGAIHGIARGDHARLVKGLDELRADVTTHALGDADAVASRMPQAAGAAASDMRQLKQVPYAPKVIQDISDSFSPTGRIWKSESVEARRTLADLASTPRTFEDNKAGITTTLDGTPPVDIAAQVWTRSALGGADQVMRDAYVAYRYGDQPPLGGVTKANMETLFGNTPAGTMSPAEFKAAVAEALYSGDKHPVQQVQSAAEYLRKSILEPVEKTAKETIGADGRPLLGPDVEAPAGDQSFFPRLWLKDAITRRRPEFVDKVSGWLRSEQTVKAEAQQRLAAQTESMRGIRAKIAAKEAEIEKAIARDGINTSPEIERLEQELADLQDQSAAIRAEMEAEIGKWRGKSANEARSALRARAKAEAEREAKKAEGAYAGKGARLTSADDIVDRTVARILASDRGLSEQELRSRASEIADRIIGTPDGRLPYDDAPLEGGDGAGTQYRGSLREREFAIPTSLVKEFVNHDPVEALHAFMRTTVPDILLTQKFGDPRMTTALKKVTDEYAAKIEAATTEKARAKLEAEKQTVIRDLTAVRDRIRNVYGYNADPGLRKLATVTRAVRNWGTATDLGSSVPNSLADATGLVFRVGLEGAFRAGWKPFFKSLITRGDFSARARRQARAVGVAMDTQAALHGRQLGEVIDYYKGGSGVEKAIGWAADKAMVANLMAPWTDMQKTIAVSAISDEVLRMCQRVSAGKASARDIRDLAAASIDESKARRIWQQHDASGVGETERVFLPDTDKWTDTAARASFEAAVARDTDIAVVSPGQEKPLFLSRSIGALIGQFKTFTASAHERVLIANLQRRDARSLAGLFTTLAAGALSYKMYSIATGKETSDEPQDWIKEAINRSGVSGWITDINAMQAPFFAGKTDMFRLIGADKPLTRYAQRGALAGLLGPTYSRLEKLQGPLYSISQGEWGPKDTRAVARWMWLQNHFAIRQLIDKMGQEEGVSGR